MAATAFPTDLEIARRAKLLPMPEIAARMGIGPHLLEPYGYDVAKIKLEAIDELKSRPKAKYVVVSAITPTPLGEAKRTTTSASARQSPSASRRWARPSASRAARPAEATARSCRWSASTCT